MVEREEVIKGKLHAVQKNRAIGGPALPRLARLSGEACKGPGVMGPMYLINVLTDMKRSRALMATPLVRMKA